MARLLGNRLIGPLGIGTGGASTGCGGWGGTISAGLGLSGVSRDDRPAEADAAAAGPPAAAQAVWAWLARAAWPAPAAARVQAAAAETLRDLHANRLRAAIQERQGPQIGGEQQAAVQRHATVSPVVMRPRIREPSPAASASRLLDINAAIAAEYVTRPLGCRHFAHSGLHRCASDRCQSHAEIAGFTAT